MLGVDIEQTSRFNDWDLTKLKRIFTKSEIEYATKQKNASQHLCGFYCVKEAFIKAAQNKSIPFKKLEVLHEVSGKPYLNLNGEIKSILKENDKTNIEISISHTADYAVAVVQIN